MNKRCTNSGCRKVFSTLEYGGRCPRCGKRYPTLQSGKDNSRTILWPVPVKLPDGSTVRVPKLLVPSVKEFNRGGEFASAVRRFYHGAYKGIRFYTASLKDARDFLKAIQDGRQPCMYWEWSGKIRDGERELVPCMQEREVVVQGVGDKKGR